MMLLSVAFLLRKGGEFNVTTSVRVDMKGRRRAAGINQLQNGVRNGKTTQHDDTRWFL